MPFCEWKIILPTQAQVKSKPLGSAPGVGSEQSWIEQPRGRFVCSSLKRFERVTQQIRCQVRSPHAGQRILSSVSGSPYEDTGVPTIGHGIQRLPHEFTAKLQCVISDKFRQVAGDAI